MRYEPAKAISIRIPPELLGRIDQAVQKAKEKKQGDWWSLSRSTWILDAIKQRLAKQKNDKQEE